MKTSFRSNSSKFLKSYLLHITIIGVAAVLITQVVQLNFSLLTAGSRSSVCGNGVIEKPEQCDDGNTMSGDGCSSVCKKETALRPSAPPSSSSSSSQSSVSSSSSSSSQSFVSCATSSSSSSTSSAPAVRYTVDPNYVTTNGKFPPQALRPQTYGYNEVAFTDADYSSVIFVPLEPAKFIGTGNTRLSLTVQSINGATFTGFIFPGSIQVVSSDNNIFEYNKHFPETVPAFRIRYGSDGNKIRYSLLQRMNIPVTYDVVGVYFSDGPNSNNEIADNDILNYTDGVQIGFRLNTDYGHGAGTYIHHNRIGVTSEFHNSDGSMVAGLENALDFKSGGSGTNVVRVECNDMFGYRPAIMAGAGTPGYAVTIHRDASDIGFFWNAIRNSEAGFALHPQYLPDGVTWFVPRVHIEGNTFTDIRNHGFASPWPTKQGSLIVSTNSATFKNNTCLRCERLEEMLPATAAGPRTGLYETTDWTR